MPKGFWQRYPKRICTSCGHEFRPSSRYQVLCDAECPGVQAILAQAAKKVKFRKCLRCGDRFLSDGAFNRICPHCQGENQGYVDRSVVFHDRHHKRQG